MTVGVIIMFCIIGAVLLLGGLVSHKSSKYNTEMASLGLSRDFSELEHLPGDLISKKLEDWDRVYKKVKLNGDLKEDDPDYGIFKDMTKWKN